MIEFIGGSKFRCLECDADLILDNGIIREPDSQVPHTWELCLENQVAARDRRMEQLTEEIDRLRHENAILKESLRIRIQN